MYRIQNRCDLNTLFHLQVPLYWRCQNNPLVHWKGVCQEDRHREPDKPADLLGPYHEGAEHAYGVLTGKQSRHRTQELCLDAQRQKNCSPSWHGLQVQRAVSAGWRDRHRQNHHLPNPGHDQQQTLEHRQLPHALWSGWLFQYIGKYYYRDKKISRRQ